VGDDEDRTLLLCFSLCKVNDKIQVKNDRRFKKTFIHIYIIFHGHNAIFAHDVYMECLSFL